MNIIDTRIGNPDAGVNFKYSGLDKASDQGQKALRFATHYIIMHKNSRINEMRQTQCAFLWYLSLTFEIETLNETPYLL